MEYLNFHARRICQKIFGVTFPSRVKHFFHPVSHNGRISIYPTLECNLRCPYCPMNMAADSFHINPVDNFPVSEWIKAINRIQAGVIISGGEPFLYPNLCSLINGIDANIRVDVFSNFSYPDMANMINDIDRPVFFYGSYHPISGTPDKFINMVKRIAGKEQFRFTIHSIGSNGQLDYLFETQKYFLRKGFKLYISMDAFELGNIGAKKQISRRVICTKRVCNFGPDGNRYNCLSKMVRRENPFYNIAEQGSTIEYPSVLCNTFGHCSVCDVIGERHVRAV